MNDARQLHEQWEREREAHRISLTPPHFIQRLKERYDIDISLEEYHATLKGRTYRGLFSKRNKSTIGTVKINGQDVWVLYNPHHKLFATCYPKVIGIDSAEMVRACFSPSVRPMAMEVHDIIVDSLKNARKDFGSDKEMAIHYFRHSPMPRLMIQQYKHGKARSWEICQEISKVLMGGHRYAKLTLNVRQETTLEETTYKDHEAVDR